MANCVFPEDIMVCILTRLPVKPLLRFKSVCKPWRELFATPNFIKMHHDQLSRDPRREDFIIFSLDGQTISVFNNIDSNSNKPTNLDIPCPGSNPEIYYVGCCNGLVCIGFLPIEMGIALWNPALRLSKFVPLELDLEILEVISLGFGYDAEGDDFKVVRIVCWKGETMRVGVEVYSAKNDFWKTIEVGFQFWLMWHRSSDIVNGNPYWITSTHGTVSLMWCDVTNLEFKTVPLSNLRLDPEVRFVEWKGSLAALACTKKEERLESVDVRESLEVWVFDDSEMIWRKSFTFGPIEMGVDRFLQCSKNGVIMGECLNGKLFVFDPESRCVKEIENDGQQGYFKIYRYNESLVYIKGMELVKSEEEEEEDEDD